MGRIGRIHAVSLMMTAGTLNGICLLFMWEFLSFEIYMTVQAILCRVYRGCEFARVDVKRDKGTSGILAETRRTVACEALQTISVCKLCANHQYEQYNQATMAYNPTHLLLSLPGNERKTYRGSDNALFVHNLPNEEGIILLEIIHYLFNNIHSYTSLSYFFPRG